MVDLDVLPPEGLKKPFIVPNKLLMGPGPSNMSPRVLLAISKPGLGHMHSELFKIMDDIKEGIQYVFQTKNKLTLAVSASGHGGMEMVLCNLLEPGDKILIFTNGIWGERAGDIAIRYNAVPIKIRKEQRCHFTLNEIQKALDTHNPKFVFMVQGESSTGIYQPLENIGEITQKFGAILIVDCVASLGAVPLFADKWKIDVLYSGSQKIIGAPPGLAPISFNDRAKERILSRRTPVNSYYWDLKLIGQQWGCFGSKQPRLYHHTTSASMLYGLREGLALIVEEGLSNVIQRHQKCAEILYRGLEKLKLDFYVTNKESRLPSVTTVKVPNDLKWLDVTNYAMKNYLLELSGGLGPTAGKVFRIGLMGYNATVEKTNFTLNVLEEALNYSRRNVTSKM